MPDRVTKVSLLADVVSYIKNIREAKDETDELKASADEFADKDYSARAGVDTGDAKESLSELQRDLDDLARKRSEAEVGVDDADARGQLDDITERLDEMARKSAAARVTVDSGAATRELDDIDARLLAVGRDTARPDVDVAGIARAQADLDALGAQLDAVGRRGVGLDTSAAQAKVSALQAALARLAAQRADATVGVSDAGAAASLDDISSRLDALAARSAQAKVTVSAGTASEQLAMINRQLLNIGQRTARPDVDLDGIAKAQSQLDVLEARLDEFNGKDFKAKAGVGSHDDKSFVEAGGGMVGTVGALGTALVPVAAAASGAVLALGSAMVATAGAGGALALAVKDNVSAFEAQAASVAKGKTALSSYSTEFQHAYLALGAFKSAYGGFQTGTTAVSDQLIGQGLSIAAGMIPRLTALANAAGGSVSGLLSDLQRFAQGPEMASFMGFLDREGPAAITAFGHIAGDMGKGLMSLMVAFAPLQSDILGGLQRVTAGFATWAAQVGSTGGFKSFLSYVETEGPRVWSALGAISSALIDIVKAAAPVGGIVLTGLREFAEVIGDVAKSPLGPWLVGAAAGFVALAKGMALVRAAQGSSLLAKLGLGKSAGTGEAAAGAEAMSRTMLAARVGALALGAGLMELDGHISASDAGMKSLADAATGVALGFAVGGPLGAAVGGAIGLLDSLTSANGRLTSAMRSASETFSDQAATLAQRGSSLSGLIKSYQSSEGALDKMRQSMSGGRFPSSYSDFAQSAGAGLSALWSGVTGNGFQTPEDKAYAQLSREVQSQGQMQAGWTSLRQLSMGANPNSLQDAFPTVTQLDAFVNEALPKLQQAGYSVSQIDKMLRSPTGQDQLWAALQRLGVGALRAENAIIGLTQAQAAWEKSQVKSQNTTASLTLAIHQAAQTDAGLADAFGRSGKQIDLDSVAGATLEQSLESIATAAGKVTGSQQHVAAETDRARAEMVRQSEAAGANAAAARREADMLLNVADKAGMAADQLERLARMRTITVRVNEEFHTLGGDGGHVVSDLGAEGHADGGPIRGPGTGRSDSIPAWLSNGEYVVNATAAARYRSQLDQINAARFAGGGPVGALDNTVLHGSVSVAVSVADKQLNAAVAAMARQLADVKALLSGRGKIAISNPDQVAGNVRTVMQQTVRQYQRLDQMGALGYG